MRDKNRLPGVSWSVMVLTRQFVLLLLIVLGMACEHSSAESVTNVSLPLETRRGHLYIRANMKGTATPVNLMLDTGFTITTLKPELAEALPLRKTGHTTIMGISGKEEAPVYDGAEFLFGNLSYVPRRVAALPSDRGSRRTDGILGAGFFRRFVVELDGSFARLYEPTNFHYAGPGEIIPLKLIRQTPVIEALLPLPNRDPVRGRFEIDTGCTGCLCLGSEFVKAHQLLEAAGETAGSNRQGVGGGASTLEGHLPQLQLGNFKINHPSVSFFREGSPAEPGLAGHVGWEALRRFKVILDYSRQQMILEPLSGTQ
ncbi:MAG TPA: retroviral-like aspartic protease family protein [Candidatus Saccharimonadales bacterium]|nr:retroviral-like aspartic protease family protein [Candidatus Saccharimonadales bacterium]